MTPATAAAMRAALEARLVNQAADQGVEAGRLRRRLVFQRIMRRLSDDDRWVLKGGYLLEARLQHQARTTRDLDLASALAVGLEELRDALESALDRDPDGDFFRFAIAGATALRADDAGQGGWRFSVAVRVAGRTFDRVRVDVVARVGETAGSTELIELQAPVDGVDLGPAHVLAVDVAQHAAEKFHAICRSYAGDRPSTRVKDLVDLVLLAEAGLLPDTRLGKRLRSVFADRDGRDPPADCRSHRRHGRATTTRSPAASASVRTPWRRPCPLRARCTEKHSPDFCPPVSRPSNERAAHARSEARRQPVRRHQARP